MSKGRLLDSDQETIFGLEIRKDLERALIGQPDAINYYVQLIEKYKSGLFAASRPIGAMLATGPTGSGKTYAAETFAESLQGDDVIHNWKHNMMRIDCGEFQHSHEIAKLVGSPPGYLGHRETSPMLSSDRVASLQQIVAYPFAILVFDEIEKASDGLWNILLGVLDKGSLMLGTNEQIDLTQTIIVLTSNAGFSDRRDDLGFLPPSILASAETKRIGLEAAKRKFSVEFINRLDAVIAFNALTKEQTSEVLNLELKKLQLEVFIKSTPNVFFSWTDAAQAALLEEGYNAKYNARNIRRAVDQQLRLPLARVVGTKQITSSETVLIDFEDSKFTFRAVARTAVNFDGHVEENDKGDILCIP